MTVTDWRIVVRDKFLNRVGELDDFQTFDLKIRFNDVSTFQIVTNRTNRLAQELAAPGAGIIVYRFGVIEFSGLVLTVQQDRTKDANVLTVSGEDDTTWLKRRLAYPDPADPSPPYAGAVADIRTGVCSTIMRQYFQANLGTTALAPRQVSGLVPSTDPVIGATLTGSGRWQTLLELFQGLAIASEAAGQTIGFRIRHSGTALPFTIYPTNDLSASIRFSSDMGNLAAFSYIATAPTMTYAIVGGDGEGVARSYVEKASALLPEWERIESEIVDARNAANATEFGQVADKALAEGAGTSSLSITPLDLDTQRYGVHYGIGDKVTVLLDSMGTPRETIVATAVGQGSAVAENYLIALDSEAVAFSIGMRVRVYRSTGLLKGPGVRTVVSKTSAFGFTNIEYRPPLDPGTGGTVAGDYLEGFIAPSGIGATIVDVVREVSINLSSQGESIVPSIGNTNAKFNPSRLFTGIRSMTRRIRNLERR